MGLIHPHDLEAFRRDEAARQSFARLRRVRASLKAPREPAPLHLLAAGPTPDVLIAMDSDNVSCRVAVLEPIRHLDPTRVALLAPAPFGDLPIEGEWTRVDTVDSLAALVPDIGVVLTAGDHVPAGLAAHRFARGVGARQVVVQHGMLLPQAAPLPEGVHVAAWTEADAVFWASGRDDLELHALGSQLLFRASQTAPLTVDLGAPPVYVGALHGTELPRREIERVARGFCLATGARYRPHPSETDLQSRMTHVVWKRLGIAFERSHAPLLDIAAPLVGMWSTGILEARAARRPAWVYHPDPPRWLCDVWERYGLTRWGLELPPVDEHVGDAPAARVAALVRRLAVAA